MSKVKSTLRPDCVLKKDWLISKHVPVFDVNLLKWQKLNTVFPHIIAAATILFWIHLVRKLFKFSFPLCNENLNSFLTRWGNYSRRGNYSREETIWGNTVFILRVKKVDLKHVLSLVCLHWHNHTGRTKATLNSMVFVKSFLYRVYQIIFWTAQPFNHSI